MLISVKRPYSNSQTSICLEKKKKPMPYVAAKGVLLNESISAMTTSFRTLSGDISV